jgi:hypothetical protein
VGEQSKPIRLPWHTLSYNSVLSGGIRRSAMISLFSLMMKKWLHANMVHGGN